MIISRCKCNRLFCLYRSVSLAQQIYTLDSDRYLIRPFYIHLYVWYEYIGFYWLR
jgi:hypothetical protein